MIRNFHVLYVGQIELDNVGRSGTPANERRYSDERLREAFATARDVVLPVLQRRRAWRCAGAAQRSTTARTASRRSTSQNASGSCSAR